MKAAECTKMSDAFGTTQTQDARARSCEVRGWAAHVVGRVADDVDTCVSERVGDAAKRKKLRVQAFTRTHAPTH